MPERDWATYTLKEAPFWRSGMSVSEYEWERFYFVRHYDDFMNQKYVPLWKQRLQNSFVAAENELLLYDEWSEAVNNLLRAHSDAEFNTECSQALFNIEEHFKSELLRLQKKE